MTFFTNNLREGYRFLLLNKSNLLKINNRIEESVTEILILDNYILVNRLIPGPSIQSR